MKRIHLVVVIIAFCFSISGAVNADVEFSLGLRVSQWSPAASDTFELLYDDALIQPGLEVQVDFADRWWVRLLVERVEESGNSVVIDSNGGFVPTGSQADIELTPIHVSLGWVTGESWQFYLGAGPSFLNWSTDDTFGSESASETGYHANIGARRRFGKSGLSGGLEVLYSSFSDAIGEGGVSAFYGEDDLGGLEVAVVGRWTFGGR